jgi:hypothetical protein
MAQAELNISLDKMSGKIYGDSDIYISHRYGKTVISHYPKHRDPSKITPHQRELNSSFAQISKQAKQELADPARRAYWQQRYDEYKSTAKPAGKYYFTLRGFVIGQLAKTNDDQKGQLFEISE